MFGGLPIYFLMSWGWVCKILSFGNFLILNVKVFINQLVSELWESRQMSEFVVNLKLWRTSGLEFVLFREALVPKQQNKRTFRRI